MTTPNIIVNTKNGNALIFYDRNITPSNKKYSVLTPSRKLIHFGATDYEHYKDSTGLNIWSHLDHNDHVRRNRYRLRHRNDNINNPEYPGYYSWWYLW